MIHRLSLPICFSILNSFYINSKSYKKRADIIYNSKELEAITGEKTSFALVVFNSFKYDKQNKYYVSYNDLNTKEFFIKGNIAKHKNIETANEEMTFILLNSERSAL